MTLDEAKALLSENNISFELLEFNNEAEYWRHTSLFPYTKNAKPCKVIAMLIKSNNGKILNCNSMLSVMCFVLKNYVSAIIAMKCLIAMKICLQTI